METRSNMNDSAVSIDSKVKSNYTILEENALVECCNDEDTLRCSVYGLEHAEVDRQQRRRSRRPISKCFATLVHNMTAGEDLDKLLLMVLSLTRCDMLSRANRKTVSNCSFGPTEQWPQDQQCVRDKVMSDAKDRCTVFIPCL